MAFQIEHGNTKKDDRPIYEATEEQDGYLTLDDATIVPRPRAEPQVDISQNLNQVHINRPANVTREKNSCRSKLALVTLPLLLVTMTMLSLQIYTSTGTRRRMDSISISLTHVITILEHTPNTTVDDVVKALGIMSEDRTKFGLARVSNSSVSDARITPCTVTACNSGGGSSFDDRPFYITHGRITALEFRVGRIREQLEGLRVRYGTEFADWRGGSNRGAFTVHRIDLEQDEVITGLTMFCGQHDAGRGVLGIGLTTNKAGNYRVYGTQTDNIICVINATWTELLYFTGRSGLIPDRLEVHAVGCTDSSATVN